MLRPPKVVETLIEDTDMAIISEIEANEIIQQIIDDATKND